MTIFGREPAFWTGTIVAIVAAVLGVLTGQGLISDIQAGTVTDTVDAVTQLVIVLAPLIAGLLIRQQVYSPPTVKTVAENAAASGNATVNVTPP